MRIVHPIPPYFNSDSEILILGSFPSVKSREQMFFYGHPQNRFWKVLAGVYENDEPITIEEKKSFLKKHKIALWDVIASCDIEGSADSTIKKVQANDLRVILDIANITNVYVNGKTSLKYYDKFIRREVRREAICLPSTSPANAVWSLQKLIEEWRIIRNND